LKLDAARFHPTRSPELWLGLQSDYDLRVAMREVGDKVEHIVTRRVA
jgi:plasmid maintenance system antidote protein VapI